MSVSLRNSLPPQCAQVAPAGSSASTSVVCQASTPSRSNRSTIVRFSAGSMIGWLQFSQRKTAMGTPQMRWRLMHQSGRVAIMLVMRSLPQAGSQTTLSISSMAAGGRWSSMPSARFDRRFQADEPLLGGAEDDRIVAAPAVRVGVLQVARRRAARRDSSSMATMTGLAAQTFMPSKAGGAAWFQALGSTWMWPPASTRQVGSRP